MILHTGIALGVTLVVLAGVLAILQYREKVCLRFLYEKFKIFLLNFSSKMIVNVNFKHKLFIMMLYDLFLVFLTSNSTDSYGQIYIYIFHLLLRNLLVFFFLFIVCFFYAKYRTSGTNYLLLIFYFNLRKE